MRNKREKRGLLMLVLLLFGSFLALTAQAQTGVICGTVTDAKFKEPLIGATVSIEGTTIGAITDIDGNFRIEKVQPDKYTLVASYVSYKTQNIKDVAVVAHQEAVVRIELSDADLQLQNVVVVAQRKLGTETAVLNTVRKSLPVVSGISAQQISKTQDSDAAEVLRRIPGITIVDDRFIVVRGLAQRYNNVWLNNATTPSSETDSRAFSFDVLPSSLIDNMMVYKSPSAELPADFSGGFVRLMTKNVPEGNTFNISYQLGFNTNATFRDFQLTKGHAIDYLGFGAGKRALPSGTPAHLNDVSTSDAAAFTRRVNTGWDISHFTALPEQKLTFTMNRLFNIGDWKIGNITNVNYSTGYDYYELKNNNYLSYDMTNDQSSYRYKYDDVQYKNTTKLGALFNWSFLKGNTKYEFRNFFNQRGSSSLTQRQGTDYYSEENIRKWESLYTGRTTYAGQLAGEHRWNDDVDKVDWTVGYAYAAYNEPDRKVVKSMERKQDGELMYYVSDPTRYYQDLKDNSFSLATNYEYIFTVSDLFKPTLNAGVYGEYKKRNFDARRFVYNLLGNGYNRFAEWDYSSIFSDENISADRIYMKESTNKSDSYTSDNLLGAGYVSAKLNYGEKLNANVGVRMEYYQLKLDGYESDGIKPVHLDQNSTEFFPSLNVAYSLTDKQQVRVAYGRSVNRPEFREVVPYVYYDFALDANITGNVDLKNAYTNSVDLRYELYPSPGETVTIGGFYKYFADPIEQTYREAGSGLQYTYHNADHAKAFGVEVDIKKHLDFIGLKDLSFVFNGAYIHSKVYFPEGSFERDRAMQGQSPYLINTGLFYQNDTKGLSASVLYNRIGKRIETVGVPAQNPNDDIPDIYEMPRNSLDLSFSKKLGNYVELKAGVKDLLNSKIEYKQFLELTDAAGAKREVEQLVRSYRPGVTVNVGVSVKF
ncbi:TonB-dependent receptor [Parabacteroides chongii]|uniref:TonB-dependent receptor n=1 Tax=Parabacteroides chongii TaxID=2685834 RepID=UPI00240D9FC1|nr:TonB-dependent receptor [Parabacteroides chongii]WFE83004.1 TonB-dependent receptor [Parabacteroides chongii]